MRHLLLIGVLFTGALLFVSACSSRVGTLHIAVVYSSNEEQEPFKDALTLRIRVDGPGVLVGPEEFAIGEGGGSLSEVPVGRNREVTVEGLGPEKYVVSRGRTGPFEIRSGDNSLSLFVGLMDTFSYINSDALGQARAFHTATLMTDGSVLLCGGITANTPWRPEADLSLPEPTDSAEIIDGNALFTRNTSGMGSARVGHSATLLESGNVLVAGGISPSSSTEDTSDGGSPEAGPDGSGQSTAAQVEVFTNGRFFAGKQELHNPRAWHRAALTSEGVVIAGGVTGDGQVTGHAELYQEGTLKTNPGMLVKRRAFTMISLEDGTLWAAGGFDNLGNPLSSTELFVPGSALWKRGPDLKVARAHHTATLLQDGTVLILGGLTSDGKATDSLELYEPSKAAIRKLEPDSQTARWSHTATLLTDGRVLVVGGFALNVNGSPRASVLDVRYFGGSSIQAKEVTTLNEPRAGHTATRLKSGMLLVTGGISGTGPSRTGEIFVY